jgi:hypothetical protein
MIHDHDLSLSLSINLLFVKVSIAPSTKAPRYTNRRGAFIWKNPTQLFIG